MAGAGHALQRHVVHVAAGQAADLLHARVGRGRRQQEDQVQAVRPAGRRRRPRIPRAGSPPPARRRRRPRPPARRRRPRRGAGRSAPPGWHSPSAPPACSRRRARKLRTTSSTCARPMPRASARSEAFWITGPSAIGSENGTPSSMMSAPPSHQAVHDVRRGVGKGVAGGDVGDQRLAAARQQCIQRARDAAHRCTSMRLRALHRLALARRPAIELGARQVGHGADVLVAAAGQVDQQVLVGRASSARASSHRPPRGSIPAPG